MNKEKADRLLELDNIRFWMGIIGLNILFFSAAGAFAIISTDFRKLGFISLGIFLFILIVLIIEISITSTKRKRIIAEVNAGFFGLVKNICPDCGNPLHDEMVICPICDNDNTQISKSKKIEFTKPSKYNIMNKEKEEEDIFDNFNKHDEMS